MRGKASTRQRLQAADCVLLLDTPRPYDLDLLVSASRLLFDARNATNAVTRVGRRL